MSDPGAPPDPVDQAYAQAEAMLSDDAARAARRARVLAAVAREPAAAPSPVRRPVWRQGGWLAAASVAGLGLFVATQLYRPSPFQPPRTAPAPAVQPPASRETAAAPAPSAEALSDKAPSPAPRPAARAIAIAPPIAKPSTPDVQPAPLPVPQAFPTPAPAPPPVITAERRAPAAMSSDAAVDEPALARGAAKQAPSAAFAAAPAALGRFRASAGAPSDPAARLRAAAAAGRTADLEALLAQGAPVDAPDAEGNTALMKAVQADRPAAAALLRRHGASLDRPNHAGERARDMAAAKGDAALNQALGLDP